MKLLYFVFLLGLVLMLGPWCCCGVCDGIIVTFSKVWPSSPTGNLEMACCTTELTTLQLLYRNNELNAFERDSRGISDIVVDVNQCATVTVALWEENVNGDLQAKCNAEKGGYYQPCHFEIYTIVPPTPSPSITESTTAVESSVVMNTKDVTTSSGSYQNAITTATNVDNNVRKNSILIIVLVVVAILLLLPTVTVVIVIIWIKQKHKTTSDEVESNTPTNVIPEGPMDQKDGSDQSDAGRQPEEQQTSMTPQHPQDDTSPNGSFRRQYSMPRHSTARSDFQTVESAQDQQAHQVQAFMENDLPEDASHSSQPDPSSIQCTDENMPGGGHVYVHNSVVRFN